MSGAPRLYSLGAQLLMWTAIALVFGPLAECLLTPSAQRTAVAAGVQPGGRGAG